MPHGVVKNLVNIDPDNDLVKERPKPLTETMLIYSISKEICTRILLCCALLWLYIDWFSHIHQAYFTGTVASNDCPSASKATLMNMDKYFMWIHYERLHNHNKAKHNETVCIFLGIYCIISLTMWHAAQLKIEEVYRGLVVIWILLFRYRDSHCKDDMV